MKRIALLIVLLLATTIYAQKPKAEAMRYEGLTTAERDAMGVPDGEYWKIYNTTISQWEYWNGDGWKAIAEKESKETIIVAEGQSNMVGTDVNIIPYDITVNPKVLIWNTVTSQWDVLSPSLDKIYFSFAKKYQETYGGIVKIILNAQGGMPIADWIQEGTTDRHQLLIDQLTNAGITKVDIHLWHQGENDAPNPDYFYDLKKRIDLLISLPQYDINEFNFLFGELYEGYSNHKIWRAAALNYENIIPYKNTSYVRSTNLITVTTGAGTNVHFDGVDLTKFGWRYFETYQNMSLGQGLQSNKTYVIDSNDSDLWDLTASTFILTDTNPWGTIVLPRTDYNKEYTITNLRSSTNVTLNTYSGTINGSSSYVLQPNKTITIKGFKSADATINENKILSLNPYKKVNVVASSINLSNAYHNSIIRLTASATITIPTGLYEDFNVVIDVISGTLTLASSGTTIEKLNGLTTAPSGTWVSIYRAFPSLETYRASSINSVGDTSIYMRSDTADSFSGLLTVTGSGGISFTNNLRIYGKEVGGATKNMLFMTSSDKVAVGSSSNPLSLSGTVVELKQSYTVASLPVSPSIGSIAYVTDSADTITYRSPVTTGGGSTVALVFFDGTNWIYH